MTVCYRPAGAEIVSALNGVDLSLNPAEVVGIIGESGSGKSTLAAALVRLLPADADCIAGTAMFEGHDVLTMPQAELRKLRGTRVALIPQDPATALNPVMKVGTQISEVLRAHLPLKRTERKKRVLELLREVGFGDAERIYSAYPHELSGGQRQRVVIAQALACRPALVIADEPTSKLDPPLQAEIMEVMSKLVHRNGAALILITHDPAVLAGFADRIVVMYAGRVVEEGSVHAVLTTPLHPYTQALLRLVATEPQKAATRATSFPVISGEPPDLTETGPGCRFEPRCPERMTVCVNQDPHKSAPAPGHCVSCFKYVQ